MKLSFVKMHGLGNDFVVLDGTSQNISLSASQIQFLADRHIGIGCDQLLIVEPSSLPGADFFYKIYNANGQLVEQCGNGARCIARFIYDMGLSTKTTLRFETLKGEMVTTRLSYDCYQVDMGTPVFEPAAIPLGVAARTESYQIKCGKQILTGGAVSMGNPHFVMQVDNVLDAAVNEIGAELNKHAVFPEGVNVGFMQILSPEKIQLRVFERGVGETLACGTGACAAVSVGYLQGILQSSVEVVLPMGSLMIDWQGAQTSIFMSGAAEFVFQGQIELA